MDQKEVIKTTGSLLGLYEWFDSNFVVATKSLSNPDKFISKLLFPKDQRQHFRKTNKFVLRNCTLIKNFIHFPINTVFNQIILNDCGVASFNIAGTERHYGEPNGYNYFGSYKIIINNQEYSILGLYDGIFLINGDKSIISTTNVGFHINSLIYNNEYPEKKHIDKLYFDTVDGEVNNIDFDFIKGILSCIVNGKTIIHTFFLKFKLREECIPTVYLTEEYEKGNIDKRELENALKRRKERKFDVRNPVYIQKKINAYKRTINIFYFVDTKGENVYYVCNNGKYYQTDKNGYIILSIKYV